MANPIKRFLKRTFGKKFTIADVILLSIIIGFPVYKIFTGGFMDLIEDFGAFIWVGVFVAFIISVLLKRARK